MQQQQQLQLQPLATSASYHQRSTSTFQTMHLHKLRSLQEAILQENKKAQVLEHYLNGLLQETLCLCVANHQHYPLSVSHLTLKLTKKRRTMTVTVAKNSPLATTELFVFNHHVYQ
jgi:hypothetical protein